MITNQAAEQLREQLNPDPNKRTPFMAGYEKLALLDQTLDIERRRVAQNARETLTRRWPTGLALHLVDVLTILNQIEYIEAQA